MSTVPVRLSSSLFNAARTTGAVVERTPTAQIEYWVRLGRVLEPLLTHAETMAVCQAGEVPNVAQLLSLMADPAKRAEAERVIANAQPPTYEPDPADAAVVIQRRADGSTRRGRWVQRRFMAFAGQSK